MERNISGASGTTLKDQLFNQLTKIWPQTRVVKEGACKGWFKRFTKRHYQRSSLRQPTETVIARANEFNRENVGTLQRLITPLLVILTKMKPIELWFRIKISRILVFKANIRLAL
jgi:hypothetical protein